MSIHRVGLRRFLRTYGVRRTVRALEREHDMCPEIAYLATWYARHDTPPKRQIAIWDLSGVEPAPMSDEWAEAFLSCYTERRGGATD